MPATLGFPGNAFLGLCLAHPISANGPTGADQTSRSVDRLSRRGSSRRRYFLARFQGSRSRRLAAVVSERAARFVRGQGFRQEFFPPVAEVVYTAMMRLAGTVPRSTASGHGRRPKWTLEILSLRFWNTALCRANLADTVEAQPTDPRNTLWLPVPGNSASSVDTSTPAESGFLLL